MQRFILFENSGSNALPPYHKQHLGKDGGLLHLNNLIPFHPDKIKKDKPGMWRYASFFPLDNPDRAQHLGEGWTPLVSMDGIFDQLRMKADFLMPTGSYKDRGASVLLNRCREMGIREVIQDSSGNAGVAVAAYAARNGIAATIFLPENTSAAKVAQVTAYGAALRKIPGNRQATAEAAQAAAEHTFYASHIFNPWFFEGIKTIAWELWEQNGQKSPEDVVVPVGNGSLLIGIYLGFKAISDNGLGEMPRLIGVQAERCSPLTKPDAPLSLEPTIAEGIAISHPPRAAQIQEIINESNGFFETVPESSIIETWKVLAQSGWLIEPTSAVTVAAAKSLLEDGRIKSGAVVIGTGHGLKTVGK